MTPTKQINVRLPLELHKALSDHHVRTGEQKSDAIRRGIELALANGHASDSSTSFEEPKSEPPASPTTAEDSVDLAVWLSGRTGMPRALCWHRIRTGRVTAKGHVWKEACVSKTVLDSIRLDGEPV